MTEFSFLRTLLKISI